MPTNTIFLSRVSFDLHVENDGTYKQSVNVRHSDNTEASVREAFKVWAEQRSSAGVYTSHTLLKQIA